jgi:hypothetical protein
MNGATPNALAAEAADVGARSDVIEQVISEQLLACTNTTMVSTAMLIAVSRTAAAKALLEHPEAGWPTQAEFVPAGITERVPLAAVLRWASAVRQNCRDVAGALRRPDAAAALAAQTPRGHAKPVAAEIASLLKAADFNLDKVVSELYRCLDFVKEVGAVLAPPASLPPRANTPFAWNGPVDAVRLGVFIPKAAPARPVPSWPSAPTLKRGHGAAIHGAGAGAGAGAAMGAAGDPPRKLLRPGPRPVVAVYAHKAAARVPESEVVDSGDRVFDSGEHIPVEDVGSGAVFTPENLRLRQSRYNSGVPGATVWVKAFFKRRTPSGAAYLSSEDGRGQTFFVQLQTGERADAVLRRLAHAMLQAGSLTPPRLKLHMYGLGEFTGPILDPAYLYFSEA